MSRIACVWADPGEDHAATQWYEDTHVPNTVAKLDTEARHGVPSENNIFKEVPCIQGSQMTIYELPDDKDVKEVDAQIQPALTRLSGNARVDTRCYKEFASWVGEEWRGNHRDIQMWIVVRWQPTEDVHDELVEWFTEEFAPGMLECAELLRIRIFKLENASSVKNAQHEQQDLGKVYRYLTFWEFDCDDLPWEILVYLGGSERWRHYVEGGLLNWQIRQYLVSQIFPGEEGAESSQLNRVRIILNDGHKEVGREFDEDRYTSDTSDEEEKEEKEEEEEEDKYGRGVGAETSGDRHNDHYVLV